MKRLNWRLGVSILLAAVSIAVYWVQIIIFHRPAETFFYLFQDLAFLPVQVLIVTVIISEILRKREAENLRHKLNMVIGAFFSAIGNQLLKCFIAFDENAGELAYQMRFTSNWGNAEFARARDTLTRYKPEIHCTPEELQCISDFLLVERPFLLGLLENPNLLENESFTDLLWATSHLAEELAYRKDLSTLSPGDYNHLAGDIERAYTRFLTEWLAYVNHLRQQYPYMYSFIVRCNPLTHRSDHTCSNNGD
ncbi:MAG: hypothetical protein ACYC27_00230 [Armatimonadota bacterium]